VVLVKASNLIGLGRIARALLDEGAAARPEQTPVEGDR
jgi:hypothetical protein